MAHVDLPAGGGPQSGDGDLSEAGTVFRNRAFVYLWSAQALSQLGSNMVLAALMATVRRTTGSDTAVALLILTFLVPAVLFSTLGGVLVERSNARIIMLATNIIRAVGIVAFIFVAPTTADANVPLVYLINFGIATATAVFAPAELTAIPRIVDRRNLMAANSIFVLTINATFAIGFGFLGPLVLNVFGPIAVYVTVATMFAAAALAIVPLPDIRPERVVASTADAAGRAFHELFAQLKEGMDFVRQHRAIAWSLAYLGISSSLIGVLGAIGPGFAVDILGLTPENFFFIMGPAGLGAVLGILFLNSYGKAIPKRLVIDIGLVSMGVTLMLLALIRPIAALVGGVAGPIEDVVPAIAPLVSLIAIVVVIATFAGIEYAFVAIPAQTALQEDLPPDVRGRIFGILNTLLSVASFLPVLLAPAMADILNLFVDGSGIPIVMGLLGLLTLWAGIASWRRNARGGLHAHDRGIAPAPGTGPEASADSGAASVQPPSEAPHRRRRRRRPATDGD